MKRLIRLTFSLVAMAALTTASACSDDKTAEPTASTDEGEQKVVLTDEEEEKIVAEAQASVSESNADEVAAALEKEIEAELAAQ